VAEKGVLAEAPPVAVPKRPARPWHPRLLLEREEVLGYLLMLPALGLLTVFVVYPFLYGIWLSLTDSRIGVPGNFVGLRNFLELTGDSIFQQTFRNTFLYTGVTTVFKLIFGLAVAVLLNNTFPLKRFVRAAVLLPWIVPTVLSALAWLWMFDSTFSVINWVLARFGIKGPVWLGTNPWPMVSLMAVNIWRGTPFYAISFLAGMQVINQELYEAAAIDGAGRWQMFRHITLPLLKPVIIIVLLLSVILTFSDFQLIYVLTRGGPANSTHLFATLAYQVGLPSGQIGLGAAISLFIFPALCVAVFLTLWYMRRQELD
jgi:multiple sugar transport system permease protein